MLETPHVAVAASIAYHIPNPWISLPLAFTSHFVFDKYPHWNPMINTEKEKYGKISKKSRRIIILDVILALFTGLTIASSTQIGPTHSLWIISACFMAVLPDLVEAPFYFLGIESESVKKWVKFKRSIQTDIPIFWGSLSQLLVYFAAIIWVFN